MGDVSHSGLTEVIICSDQTEARRVQLQIEDLLAAHRYSEYDIFSVKLALEEALVNAIKHGNQFDRAKKVRIAYQVRPDRFDVFIADEGGGFDPNDVPDPTAPENLERPCGRGVMLMRYFMNVVAFNQRGNHVSMTKFRNGHPQPQC
jgi:serine/threonine-protein kinase RsbW